MKHFTKWLGHLGEHRSKHPVHRRKARGRSELVAFIFSTLLSLAMVGISIMVGKRRAPGTPLTWGEAIVATVWLTALMLLVYGIVPNEWLRWADNELKWRKDVFFDPFGTGSILPIKGWGQITFPKEVLRDIIASLIYVVALVGHVMAWLWWQKRGKAKPSTDIEASAYGRPLVRKV